MFDFPLAPLAVPPISRRRSKKRFGLPSRARSAAHSEIGTHQILHACWDFFHPPDRLAITIAYPWMGDYARLRRDACVHRSTIAAALRAERPSPDTVPPLCPFRSRFLGAALASFNFRHSSVVRWLGGEFTNSNRNWADLASRVADACATAPPSGYPTLEPVLAMRAFAEGVPLAGRFTSSRRDMIRRLLYNNHPPAIAAAGAVRAKFAAEEALSFHIPYPRFLAIFIDGLMLSPISWIMQKGKGRLIIDASTLLAPNDTGAPNGHIPPPGEPGRFEENPPVYYSSALRRHCSAVWNLRIGHPREDLMQHTDDVDSAFRRILYHPILAVVFSYVFQELLLVPVGNIFGSRSAPSWFTTPAEIRAHMANTLEYSSADYELARDLLIPDEPSPDIVLQFAPAVADRLNQGIRSIPRNPGHHAMFVDDNICVAIRSLIAEAVAGAVGSAYECFGDPVTNARRGSVLAAKKFEPTASHRVVFVGYIIDTREMRVIWPDDKRTRARDIIDTWLNHHTSRSPVEVSQLLGLLRHGIAISAAGNFLSIRLQTVMSHCMKSAGQKKIASRAWWHKHRIYIPAEVKRDLRMLRASLEPSIADIHWSRPIGLLIRREPTAVLLSDASYGGIGGWSETFSFCWSLSRQELLDHGFPMKVIDKSGEAVDNGDGIHINILEFIAIIINIWIAITSSIHESPAVGGHYVSVLADNTSALSWLRHAARSRNCGCGNVLGFSHPGKGKRCSGCAVPSRDVRVPGLRYQVLLPVTDLSCFPPAFQSLVLHSQDDFIRQDRGRVRQRNDESFDARAAFFAAWLHRLRLSAGVLSSLSSGQSLSMMGVFLRQVAAGDNLAQRTDLSDDTIRQYLSAAASYMRFRFHIEVPVFLQGNGSHKGDQLNPFLGEVLAARRNWKRPQRKKEAFSSEMLDMMCTLARKAWHSGSTGWLSRDAVFYDFVILSIFTGSRLAEYGQSSLPPGSKPDGWNTIPDNDNVPPEWRGKPIAFLAEDFQFFTKRKVLVPHHVCIKDKAQAEYVAVRFRYDKSTNNFVFRQYRRIRESHICAVSAALRIIKRAYTSNLLKPDREPLGMFLGKNGQRYSIKGHHMSKYLQEVCILAHPDPHHYLRLLIRRLMSHGNRVTAAVLLFNAGVAVDDIAFRLRWNSDAVKLYIRDCDRTINDITSKVVAGAYFGASSQA